jgi:hypothetical protein
MSTPIGSEQAARSDAVRQRILEYAHLYGIAEPAPEPRWRYFSNRGTPERFCWTTQSDGGQYRSWIYVPCSEQGVAGEAVFERTREVTHATRKATKARALRLVQQAADQRVVPV